MKKSVQMRDSDILRCLSVYHLHYPLSTKEAEDKIGENDDIFIFMNYRYKCM